MREIESDTVLSARVYKGEKVVMDQHGAFRIECADGSTRKPRWVITTTVVDTSGTTLSIYTTEAHE